MSESTTKDHRVLSDHPIAPEMRTAVIDALARIEHEENVTVLFACESGSRGWALHPLTATTTSASFTSIDSRGT